jgi:hypothetical protein
MSDDDMYWPARYPWSRRPVIRSSIPTPTVIVPADPHSMRWGWFKVILTLLWVVFISGIVFAALAMRPPATTVRILPVDGAGR